MVSLGICYALIAIAKLVDGYLQILWQFKLKWNHKLDRLVLQSIFNKTSGGGYIINKAILIISIVRNI